MKKREDKDKDLARLRAEFEKAQSSIFLTGYEKMTVQQDFELRKAIRGAGGYVLGQDEATSDVYGMNKAAYQAGNVDRQFALGDVGTVVAAEVKRLLALQKETPAGSKSVAFSGK